jgi:hypothetical protein
MNVMFYHILVQAFLIKLLDFSPDETGNIDHDLNDRLNRLNTRRKWPCFMSTASSTGFGGGPRRSFASSSMPDNNLPKSMRNETTKSRTEVEHRENKEIF